MSFETLAMIWEVLKVKRPDDGKKENLLLTENHLRLGQDAFFDEFKDLKYQAYDVKYKLKLSEDI
jgi:hypothetical protein